MKVLSQVILNKWILIFISIIFGSCGQIFMKKGTLTIGVITKVNLQIIYKIITSSWILLGLFMYGIGSFAWIISLSRLDLSYLFPINALGYIIVSFLGYLLFKEQVTVLRISGLIFVCIGVALIARS
jgi:drug/metabolite transporter (DMT)-like permease